MIKKAKRRIKWFIVNLRYVFNPFKPIFILRLIKNFILSFCGIKILRYVDFAIGYKCNLNCKHCFAFALENPNRRKISPQEFSNIVKECMKLGALNFSFQGGEPLIYPDLEKYIKAAQPNKNLISVTTNGLLLNEKNLLSLKKLKVDILTISLDSGIKQEHDEFRNFPGAFEKTLQNIKLALKNGFKVTIGTVATHSLLKGQGLTKLIEISEKLKVILMIILPVPSGKWAGSDEVLLTEEEIEKIKLLTKKYAYVRTDFQSNYWKRGCGAGKEILYLTPYGDVLICPFIPISFGNVFSDSIKNIRGKALSFPFINEYSQKCLCGEDRNFIKNYLTKAALSETYPAPYNQIFKERT